MIHHYVQNYFVAWTLVLICLITYLYHVRFMLISAHVLLLHLLLHLLKPVLPGMQQPQISLSLNVVRFLLSYLYFLIPLGTVVTLFALDTFLFWIASVISSLSAFMFQLFLCEKANLWHNVWGQAGSPSSGVLHQIKRFAKSRYKYEVRHLRCREQFIRREKMAAALASFDSKSFWQQVHRVN